MILIGWIRENGAVPNAFVSEAGLITLLIGQTVAEVERDLIIATLRSCNGNRTRAAKTLDIAVRTLRNKINEYVANGLDIPPPVHLESELSTNH
jgi:DNA-binding NtrC family response regulator